MLDYHPLPFLQNSADPENLILNISFKIYESSFRNFQFQQLLYSFRYVLLWVTSAVINRAAGFEHIALVIYIVTLPFLFSHDVQNRNFYSCHLLEGCFHNQFLIQKFQTFQLHYIVYYHVVNRTRLTPTHPPQILIQAMNIPAHKYTLI